MSAMIGGLEELSVYLEFTNHLRDRDFYVRLRSSVLAIAACHRRGQTAKQAGTINRKICSGMLSGSMRSGAG